jgi:two-component system alkaline phosphatase synthesis response regulator PhoP
LRSVLFVGRGGEEVEALARELESDGYRVSLCPAGGAEDTLTAGDPPDVLVVDLAVAGEDPAIRRLWDEPATTDSPAVIALVGREQLPHHDLPAAIDDFLALPAAPGELAARLRRALRRRRPEESERVLRCGDLTIDMGNYMVFVADRQVNLTYKEYELLRFLATNADTVFTRETLLNKVWGYDFYGGARTVDVHVRRLRSKIEDRYHSFIETVRNVGYRFRTSLP